MIKRFNLQKHTKSVYHLTLGMGKNLCSIFFTDWTWEEDLKQINLTSKDSLFFSAYFPLHKETFEKKIKIADGKYSPHVLAGVGRKSGDSNPTSGTKVCYVEKTYNGDNFNKSLCGRTPSLKSMGWYEASLEVTCEKCLKRFKQC